MAEDAIQLLVKYQGIATMGMKILIILLEWGNNKLIVGKLWSRRWDSNPQPTDYKSVALPIELRRPGTPSGTRTPNQLIKSQLLYRLS